MIRERLPDATIITFWHIPWPNPEAFAICPQREELLDGLLGSSILGFHTQFHCNNFLDTVDRQLEARVDRETFAVSYRGAAHAREALSDLGRVAARRGAMVAPGRDDAARVVRERLGLPPDQAIGIGVDRLDYTKGLEERFRAVERLHGAVSRSGSGDSPSCRSPRRRGAASSSITPTRTGCTRSPSASTQRFANRRAPAILLRAEHHDAHEVFEYLPRGGSLLRQQPARRHEPGREGVRRVARRRARAC